MTKFRGSEAPGYVIVSMELWRWTKALESAPIPAPVQSHASSAGEASQRRTTPPQAGTLNPSNQRSQGPITASGQQATQGGVTTGGTRTYNKPTKPTISRNSSGNSNSPSEFNPGSRRRNADQCYNCGLSGHWAADCTRRRGDQCRNCNALHILPPEHHMLHSFLTLVTIIGGKYGHWAEDCTSRPGEKCYECKTPLHSQ
jgi:hypothetical protein